MSGRFQRITIRDASPDDREFIIRTSSRLSEFGAPSWRTPDEIVEGEVRTLRAFFDHPTPTSSLLVAEADGRPQGFVFLEEVRDYFTLETHGHVGILAVAAEAEGRGAGRSLMQAAEDWARSRGYRKLTLSVFEHNRRARALYEHVGFAPDTIKYLKPL